MTFVITGGEQVPEGTYEAVLQSVEEGSGQFGPQRKWNWLVQVGEKVEMISSLTSMNTGPQSKAFKWLTALMGAAPKAGDEIDPMGKKVLMTVKHNEKGFAQVEDVQPFSEPQQVLEGIPR